MAAVGPALGAESLAEGRTSGVRDSDCTPEKKKGTEKKKKRKKKKKA